MKRNEISVKALQAKGYRDFEFSDFGMEEAITYIKNGAKCELVPAYPNFMVAKITFKVGVNVYEKEAFVRPMTSEEKIQYAVEMGRQREKDEKVSAKIHARNRARMKRR